MRNLFVSGACHGDELAYLFKPNILDSKILPGTKDYATMETLTKIWTDFAKFGNPMPEKSWSPISHNNFSYMEINEVLTQRSDFFKSDFEFWKSVQDIASKKV